MIKSPFNGKRTRSILRELVNRIADQAVETGRDDLAQTVYLLESMVDAEALKRKRSEILEILSSDAQVVEIGALILTTEDAQRSAMLEKESATAH